MQAVPMVVALIGWPAVLAIMSLGGGSRIDAADEPNGGSLRPHLLREAGAYHQEPCQRRPKA
jgi:hypothetical protein